MKTSKRESHIYASQKGLRGIYTLSKNPGVLLSPLTVAICVPQSHPPLIGPLAEKCCCQMFCIAVSCTDMPGIFKDMYIQNPRDQVALTIIL
jgi:hypothetical protein